MQVSIIFYRGRHKIATVKNGAGWSVQRMRYNATQLRATRFVVRYEGKARQGIRNIPVEA